MSAEREGLRAEVVRHVRSAAWEFAPALSEDEENAIVERWADRILALLGEREEPVAWVSQVQNEDGTWHPFFDPRRTEDAARRDVEGLHGVFRVVPLYSEPPRRASESEREDVEWFDVVHDFIGRKWCNVCESYDHECGCVPDIRARYANLLANDIRVHLRASEPAEAERKPYRSPQIINVADALKRAESHEGEER